MQTLRRWLRRPEIAIPLVVLAVSLVLVGGGLAVFRPEGQFAAAIVAAVVAVIGSSLSLTLGRYFDKQREIELALRAKKIPEYEKFAGFWFDMLMADKLGKKPMTSQQMTHALIGWTKPLIMWGSDDVIRRWGQLRVSFDPDRKTERATAEERTAAENLFRFEDFLMDLRRDVGYPETRLGRGDILRLWINDIDRYL